jgi:DNA-binding winged helix-turn-helix (wHTH) protein/tetratricopeptide (TPR) repeat protein
MRYRFGLFTLDDHACELRRDGELVPLRRQAFDVLRQLASASGQCVSRDELFAKIWGSRAVTDNTLTQCIAEIRRALGENGQSGGTVRTLHRRGFRLDAAIEELPMPKLTPLPWELESRTSAYLVRVAPFAGLSGDGAESAFGAGVAEDLVAYLTRLGVFEAVLTHGEDALRAIWPNRREPAAMVLTQGSVQLSAGRFCVRVRVVGAGGVLWADRFECASEPEGESLLAGQARIAAAIGGTLQHALLRSIAPRLLRSPECSSDPADLALRGLVHLARRRRADNQRAIVLFARAAELDEDAVLPVFGLGRARYLNAYHFWCEDPAAELMHTRWAAQRCLTLAPHMPAGHLLSSLASFFDGDAHGALSSAHLAVEADEHSRDAQSLLGRVLAVHGQPDEALRRMELAAALGGLKQSAQLFSSLASGHFSAERYAEAAECAERAVLHAPHSLSNQLCLAACCGLLGQRARASRAAADVRRTVPSFPEAIFRRILAASPPKLRGAFFDGLTAAGVTSRTTSQC